MDINANLKEQLRLANEIIEEWDDGFEFTDEQRSDVCHKAQSLAELVLAQNEWFKNFGFLPDQWKKHNPTEERLSRARKALQAVAELQMNPGASLIAKQALKDLE